MDCRILKKAVLWHAEISITIHPAIQPNTQKDLAINVKEVTMLYVRNFSDKVCGNEKALAAGREAVTDLPNRRVLWKNPRLVWKYFSVRFSQIFEKPLLYFDGIHPVALWTTINYKFPSDTTIFIFV